MHKYGILASIIVFLPSMLVAQIGRARPAGSENQTRATIFGDIPIFVTTATDLAGGKDRARLILTATLV